MKITDELKIEREKVLSLLKSSEELGMNTEYEKGLLRQHDKLTSQFQESLKRLKEHIKEVMWCNAHDKGLLEDLIRFIDDLSIHSPQTKPKILSLRPTECANSVSDGIATFNEVRDKTADTNKKENKEK